MSLLLLLRCLSSDLAGLPLAEECVFSECFRNYMTYEIFQAITEVSKIKKYCASLIPVIQLLGVFLLANILIQT